MNGHKQIGYVVPVEVCVESSGIARVAESVRAALAGGASRIELCSDMSEDGLTPPTSHIEEARQVFGDRTGLVVMIRPRPGDFFYTPAEIGLMHRQVRMAGDAGAEGVALGILRKDRKIDVDALFDLVRDAHEAGLRVTFHRAFDAVSDREEAVEALVKAGVDRVLTSGLPYGSKGTLLDGLDTLASTITWVDSRLEVVLSGGVNASNVRKALASLPIEGKPVSVHAYSGVRMEGRTDEAAVRKLVEAATPQ